LNNPRVKLFIFGATGDLVRRKVFPAFAMLRRGTPPLEPEIIALGRKDLDSLDYPGLKIKYEKASFSNSLICEGCEKYLNKSETNYFYSALPPAQQELVIRYVAAVAHEGYQVRLLLEKPFGTSLAGAEHLKDVLEKSGILSATLLCDHYLFKESVMKLGKREFKKLKIVVLEKEGVGERLAYYDGVGALRDMIQSHFLNTTFRLLENPESEFINFEILKFRKEQYPEYKIELGRESETETFVELELKTELHEYEFVTGKKRDKREAYIEIDPSTTLGAGARKFDLDAGPNPYEKVMNDFLSGNKSGFASVENAILAWRIIEKIDAK